MEMIQRGTQGDKKNASANNRGNTEHGHKDWVCLRCENFNFSFRDNCNRCKAQTRDENERTLAHYYAYLAHCQQNTQLPELIHYSHSWPIEDPSEETPQSPRLAPSARSTTDGLPSVSPLLKKCQGPTGGRKPKAAAIFQYSVCFEEGENEGEFPVLISPRRFKERSWNETDDQLSPQNVRSIEKMII